MTEYYCKKCEKKHSIAYHPHKRFAYTIHDAPEAVKKELEMWDRVPSFEEEKIVVKNHTRDKEEEWERPSSDEWVDPVIPPKQEFTVAVYDESIIDNILEEIKEKTKDLPEKKVNKVLEEVYMEFKKAKVDAGESVGLVSAESIGEPGTQMSIVHDEKIIVKIKDKIKLRTKAIAKQSNLNTPFMILE